MEKLEIRAVIKHFCKKGMSPKEIHGKPWEEFSFFIAQRQNGQQSLKGRVLRMMDSLAGPKKPPLMKMSWSCTPWLCVIGGENNNDVPVDIFLIKILKSLF